jgi:hypothetical protein
MSQSRTSMNPTKPGLRLHVEEWGPNNNTTQPHNTNDYPHTQQHPAPSQQAPLLLIRVSTLERKSQEFLIAEGRR